MPHFVCVEIAVRFARNTKKNDQPVANLEALYIALKYFESAQKRRVRGHIRNVLIVNKMKILKLFRSCDAHFIKTPPIRQEKRSSRLMIILRQQCKRWNHFSSDSIINFAVIMNRASACKRIQSLKVNSDVNSHLGLEKLLIPKKCSVKRKKGNFI